MSKVGAAERSAGAGKWPLVLLVALVPVIAGLALIHMVSQPPVERVTEDPADLMIRAEPVEFTSSDGVPLSGWLVAGRPGAPPIVLCHDLGESRSSLLSTAIVLNHAGYPVLLFDFRRHGASGARRSTFGITERFDVQAAVDLLAARAGVDHERMGAWGVGMGAYAIALAAPERQALTALALDGLYRDVPTEIDRRLRERLPPLASPLVPAVRLLYNLYFMSRLERHAVADVLPELSGRNVLLISGADDQERRQEARALYEALPESPRGSKNLLELEASGAGGLYSGDRRKYDDRIREFFTTYLPIDAAEKPQGDRIEVQQQ